MSLMKAKICQKLWVAASLVSGGISQQVLAEGPADLEALAEKARTAAESVNKMTVEEAPEEEAASEPVEEVTEEKVAVAQAVPADPTERIEKLGLISHLSPKVDAVTAFQNGRLIWEELNESALGQILLQVLADEEIDIVSPDGPGPFIGELLAEDVLLAFGDGTKKQFSNLLSVSSLLNRYQIALLVGMLASDGVGADELLDNSAFVDNLTTAMSKDPDFLVNLASSAQMPPILLGVQISGEALREQVVSSLSAGGPFLLTMVGEEAPFLTLKEAEVAGISFSGLAVDGALFVEQLDKELGLVESLSEFVGPASAQVIYDALAEKDLVLLSGTDGDRVYLFLGSEPEQIPLVTDPAESLAASDALSFLDSYLAEKWLNVSWNSKALNSTGYRRSVIEDYAEGLRIGLEGNEGLSEFQKLLEPLSKALALEEKVLALGETSASASVAFLKADGLHIESVGGYSNGLTDLETPFGLGTLADETFLTTQWIAHPENSKLGRDYLETSFQIMYDFAKLAGTLDTIPPKWAQFTSLLPIFDLKMKADVADLWKGINIATEGLSNEVVLEVDLAGSLPTVPGLTDAIIEKGPTPRLSYLVPVTDRAKLAESWQQINASAAKLLKTAGELAQQKIPMQKPMSSVNDGLKTWFFPIPMQTDDFVPSVTLNDELLILGTSKERSLALAKVKAREEEEKKSGIVMTMNVAPLQNFLTQWLALIAEDPEAVLQDEEALEFFNENEEQIKTLVAAFSEFHSWHFHTRKEDGELRNSIHLKTN